MSEDREQRRDGERDDATQPSSAAARRGRRASARSVSRKSREGRAGEAGSTATGTKGRPTPARDGQKQRVSPFQKIARFVREVVAELRKVLWPSRKQLVTYTLTVLVFVTFIVALVAGLDQLFTRGVLWVFG